MSSNRDSKQCCFEILTCIGIREEDGSHGNHLEGSCNKAEAVCHWVSRE